MTLWIDADACAREAKELIFRASERLAVPTVLVANALLSLPPRLAHVRTVQVGRGADEADRYIAEQAASGDLAVTADVPLAAKLVKKGVAVIDPRGEAFTPDNVEDRLSMRDLMQSLRDSGLPTSGPGAYDAKARQSFANALDRLLTAARRSSSPGVAR